jgi:hypothetical protein
MDIFIVAKSHGILDFLCHKFCTCILGWKENVRYRTNFLSVQNLKLLKYKLGWSLSVQIWQHMNLQHKNSHMESIDVHKYWLGRWHWHEHPTEIWSLYHINLDKPDLNERSFAPDGIHFLNGWHRNVENILLFGPLVTLQLKGQLSKQIVNTTSLLTNM